MKNLHNNAQNQLIQRFFARTEIGNGKRALENQDMFLFHLMESQPEEVLDECLNFSVIYNETSSISVLIYLASFYAEKGEYDKSIEIYDKANKINDKVIEIYINRGIVNFINFNYIDALTDIKKAISLEPLNILALSYEVKILIQLSRNKEAVKLSDIIINNYPNSYIGYEIKGDVLQSLHEFNFAIDSYSHGIKLSPDMAQIYYKRSIAYGNNGQLRESLRDIYFATKIEPNNSKYAELFNEIKKIYKNKK